eukprot:1110801-Pleurochrysis_carterae.AAC.4
MAAAQHGLACRGFEWDGTTDVTSAVWPSSTRKSAPVSQEKSLIMQPDGQRTCFAPEVKAVGAEA